METMDSQIAGRATARPAVIPDDVDGPAVMKASGRVRLPLNVRWSGPDVVYDLADRRDRARVYEQVLREGPTTTSATSSTLTRYSTFGRSYSYPRTFTRPGRGGCASIVARRCSAKRFAVANHPARRETAIG